MRSSSKHLARLRLDHFESIALPGGFGELRLAENRGSFLSLGDSPPESTRLAIFTFGTGFSLLGLLAYLVGDRLGRCNFIGLALVWVGGTSNLIDRVFQHGLVTDFMMLRLGLLHTGIFNAADVMIMAGLGILIYDCWKRRQPGIAQPPANASP